MSKIQKIIIIVYGILVAVACIYVPWMAILPILQGIPVSVGYSLIWQPIWPYTEIPALLKNLINEVPATVVDFKRVILEIIAITAVFAVLFVLTLRSKKVLPGS